VDLRRRPRKLDAPAQRANVPRERTGGGLLAKAVLTARTVTDLGQQHEPAKAAKRAYPTPTAPEGACASAAALMFEVMPAWHARSSGRRLTTHLCHSGPRTFIRRFESGTAI
jgi:hypothetical protein